MMTEWNCGEQFVKAPVLQGKKKSVGGQICFFEFNHVNVGLHSCKREVIVACCAGLGASFIGVMGSVCRHKYQLCL